MSRRSNLLISVLAVAVLSLPLALAAQETDGTMPVYKGKGKVTEAVDTVTGALYDIGGGITLLLPRGLPIGHSRVLTLKKAKGRFVPSQVHKRFRKHGQTLHFDGALNAPGNPIILAMAMKREPKKRGYKFVLAMEEAGLCNDANKKYKLGHGLCSVWKTVDTVYQHAAKRVVAKLDATGGMRLQFGWIPEEKKEEK
jgi:hypothetical protein